MAQPPATCVYNHTIPRYICSHPPTSSHLKYIYKHRDKYKYKDKYMNKYKYL